MRYSISINELAELDIREGYLDYEEKLIGLGVDFKSEIETGIQFISENAQAIQIRHGIIRIYFLKRFPFGIHFYINQNEVHVIGVFAMRDNPDRWDR